MGIFDFAIIGSSFAGSLASMIASRLGKKVILIERGQHPRFAIGESSTPMANLLLEELADKYQLPRLKPLCKWGSWQRTYPQVACGLKRGFTFYQHNPGEMWTRNPLRSNELMVAASPHNEIADTHWYRPDFDHFMVSEAATCGVEYIDRVLLERVEMKEASVVLSGSREGRPFQVEARWIIDSSGPSGFLYRQFGLQNIGFINHPPTGAVYSHFTGVKRWDPHVSQADDPPYPPDDAALHHVFPNGWMWVLRFNNGITSAGFTFRPGISPDAPLPAGDLEWDRCLARFPSIRGQFSEAQIIRPFTTVRNIAFRCERAVGDRWMMLPGTAGFVDPLLSTGFVLSLLGVQRLGDWIENGMPEAGLQQYEIDTFADLDAAVAYVGGLYRSMGSDSGPVDGFERYRHFAMIYFAAVTYSEMSRRLGNRKGSSFLLRKSLPFHEGAMALLQSSGEIEESQLSQAVRQFIEPYSVAGLADPAKRHWYGIDPNDALEGAPKLRATRQQVETMLRRVGMSVPTSAG